MRADVTYVLLSSRAAVAVAEREARPDVEGERENYIQKIKAIPGCARVLF